MSVVRHARARGAVKALSDDELMDAMGNFDPWAWNELDERFRPLLERYAERVGAPTAEWPSCIDEVLESEGMRLSSARGARPKRLAAYLVGAVRNRWLVLRRAEATRERHEVCVSEGNSTYVAGTLSEASVRDATGGSGAQGDDAASAVSRFVRVLIQELSDEERLLLAWAAECVPHRTIAEWTGTGYDATTKRLWRLCRRLRARSQPLLLSWDATDEERALVARALGVVSVNCVNTTVEVDD